MKFLNPYYGMVLSTTILSIIHEKILAKKIDM